MKNYYLALKHRVGCVYRGIQNANKNQNIKIRTKYAYYYKYCKIKENIVLYEAYFGKGMLCNPYAIFQELLNDLQYADLKHIWVLKDMNSDKLLIQKYADRKNVVFIKYNSKEYLKYLCSAKYLINNVTFPTYFTKKEGQVYVNTWHGIPLKTLGYDIPNSGVELSNVIRNFLHTDYLISASGFLTGIYQKSHKLENIYQGKIIEEGYPRLDILINSDRESVLEKLRSYGVEIDSSKKVILFAPTWRGVSYAKASTDVAFYFSFKETLEQMIDTSRYQILIKVHQRVYELAKKQLTESYFIPSMIDANEVLAITDILVSDFSSIYIDFLATGKPILFYIPDLESYTEERGLYRTPDCLPGPCATEVEQIANWINNLDVVIQQYQKKYNAERTWSNGYHAGEISKKIVDIIFAGNENGYKIHYPCNTKKRILISRGMMMVNGISASLLSLLDNLDYDKFDVSVMICSTKKDDERNLIERINPKVRILCRNSAGCFTLEEHILQVAYSRYGYKNIFHPMYTRDVKRSYGNALFDYVIDFEGLNTYYAILALQFTSAHKCIWLHSDIWAERNSRFSWLDNVFGFYKYFNKIVSCSYDVMIVNQKNLAGIYATSEKFDFMKNFMDINRLEKLRHQSANISLHDDAQYIVLNESRTDGCLSTKMLPLVPNIDKNGNRNHRFVTVGRISIEKNHKKLVQAFAKLQKDYSNVYLYILGDGPLRKEIINLASKLKLTDNVFIPGNIENPFAIMKNCDCFILPSLHEGQPMVIHEARGLKMPIIVSNFSSVNGILVENGQLVIGMEAEDIYEGMQKFIDGKVPADYVYDMHKYNNEAYQEFLHVLGEADV